MTIDYFRLGHPLTRFRSEFALRARKSMFDLFMDKLTPGPESKVLDLGVTPDQSLAESNLFEALYPWKHKVVAASIEDARWLEQAYPGMRFVQIVPGPLPFENEAFDFLFCSAVIEHVGDRDAQRRFVAECLRVSKAFFLTTPNRQFPLEFHTFLPLLHWLPQPAHQALLRRLGLEFWAKTENLNLLTPRSFRALFPACGNLNVYTYRLLGLPSNIVVYGFK
jgi:hypothetical protein